MTAVRIDADDLRNLLNERDHLRNQVNELQSRMTEMASESRAASPRIAVTSFHVRFGYPVRCVPAVPIDAEVRFRAERITEEYFEVMGTLFVESRRWERAHASILGFILEDRPRVDLPQLAGELADLEYVTMGARLDFGIPDANARAVWAANLAKDPARDGKGKPTKPPGWVKPDHVAILRDHGWRGVAV
jgi:predicted HAD superfamily Cof-like phosphohydrolase